MNIEGLSVTKAKQIEICVLIVVCLGPEFQTFDITSARIYSDCHWSAADQGFPNFFRPIVSKSSGHLTLARLSHHVFSKLSYLFETESEQVTTMKNNL